MFEDLYIPWTSRYPRRETTAPPLQPEPAQAAVPCPRTLHIARAIMAKAVEPFPEVARAISAAFGAYIRGELKVNMVGDPSSWTAT